MACARPHPSTINKTYASSENASDEDSINSGIKYYSELSNGKILVLSLKNIPQSMSRDDLTKILLKYGSAAKLYNSREDKNTVFCYFEYESELIAAFEQFKLFKPYNIFPEIVPYWKEFFKSHNSYTSNTSTPKYRPSENRQNWSKSNQNNDRSNSSQNIDKSKSTQNNDRSNSSQNSDRSKFKRNNDRSNSSQNIDKSKSTRNNDRSNSSQNSDRSKSTQNNDRPNSSQNRKSSSSNKNKNFSPNKNLTETQEDSKNDCSNSSENNNASKPVKSEVLSSTKTEAENSEICPKSLVNVSYEKCKACFEKAIYLCERCGVVPYCSKKCVEIDFPRHRYICKIDFGEMPRLIELKRNEDLEPKKTKEQNRQMNSNVKPSCSGEEKSLINEETNNEILNERKTEFEKQQINSKPESSHKFSDLLNKKRESVSQQSRKMMLSLRLADLEKDIEKNQSSNLNITLSELLKLPRNQSYIEILSVYKPNLIYVRSLDVEDSLDFAKNKKILSDSWKKSKVYDSLPNVGTVCLAEYELHTYFRLIVLRHINKDTVKVKFIENCQKAERKFYELKYAPEEVMALKCYAVCVRLQGIPDDLEQHKGISDFLKHLSANVHAKLKIHYNENLSQNQQQVHITDAKIYYENEKKFINESILLMVKNLDKSENTDKKLDNVLKKEKDVEDSSDVRVFSKDIKIELPKPGEDILVCITDNSTLDDGIFSCILKTHLKILDKLNEKCIEYGEKSYEPYTPTKNEICLVKYDDEWYRAECLGSVLNKNKISVLFIDYGNVSNVDIDKVRKYPRSLHNKRCYTFKCLIADLPNEINKNVAKKLKELLRENSQFGIEEIGTPLDNERVTVYLPTILDVLKLDELI